MLTRTLPVRVAAEALFFACVFSGFYWEATGNYFCNEAGATGRELQTLHVALILTAWDAFSSVCAMAIVHRVRDVAAKNAACLWLSGGIAAIGYFSAQFVLFAWNEAHRLHGLLDCSCFFTEGYGIMFPLLTAPILIVGSIVREALTLRVLNRQPHAQAGE
jgi:heme/copper-type cytochrome/quinol oxidase subunit 3